MDTQTLTPEQTEQKLWQHELEMIAQEIDSLLNLLASLQNEHLICTKHDDKIAIFFNYFQYFFQTIRHLQEGLITIDKEVTITPGNTNKINYTQSNFKEEMDCLKRKYEIFKLNFKDFISHINCHKYQI